jgi:hypothetical protein
MLVLREVVNFADHPIFKLPELAGHPFYIFPFCKVAPVQVTIDHVVVVDAIAMGLALKEKACRNPSANSYTAALKAIQIRTAPCPFLLQ